LKSSRGGSKNEGQSKADGQILYPPEPRYTNLSNVHKQ